MNINQPSKVIAITGRRRKGVDLDYHDEVGHHHKSEAFGWMSKTIRGHTVAMIGEFVGTFLFLFMSFSVGYPFPFSFFNVL